MEAEVMVMWPSGPVKCCRNHACQLVRLNLQMGGMPLAVIPCIGDNECVNCINEKEKEVVQ